MGRDYTYIDKIFFDAQGHTPGNIYYIRLVNRGSGYVWDNVAGAVVAPASAVWANSVITLVEDGTTGAYPVVIPADLPAGTWEVIVYSQATSVPLNTDDVEDQYEAKVGGDFGF